MFRIDLHLHYKTLARRSDTHEEAMLQAFAGKGLDAVVFTEHHQVMLTERLAELNAKYAPLRIFQGVEITAWERRDYLVYGMPWGEVPMPRMKRIRIKDLLDLAERYGAAVCAAHPLCYPGAVDIPNQYVTTSSGRFGIHAVEVASGYVTLAYPETVRMAAAIGAARGWSLLCGSDAHEPKHVPPKPWHSVARQAITTEAELVAAVKDPKAWV